MRRFFVLLFAAYLLCAPVLSWARCGFCCSQKAEPVKAPCCSKEAPAESAPAGDACVCCEDEPVSNPNQVKVAAPAFETQAPPPVLYLCAVLYNNREESRFVHDTNYARRSHAPPNLRLALRC